MLSYPRFTSIPCFVEALKSGEASIADMVEEYNRRRLVMVKRLNDIGLSCFEPRGAFYAFPSIRSTGMTLEKFTERLLIEEKVAEVPGSAFGKGDGKGHLSPGDAVVGQILRYMGWVKEHLGKSRGARGIIIAKETDERLQYAPGVMPDVNLYSYSVSFSLHKKM